MKLLNLTLDNPAANIALDEALLESAEQHGSPLEVLRLWESPQPMVVLGRSSRVDQEVEHAACLAEHVPVIRRCSGGASVLAGPGCLMYAVVLSCERRPDLRLIDQAHQFVLGRLAESLARVLPDVQLQGISDLTRANRKVSGNSMRCKRRHLLYHGTLLYDFPLAEIGRLLKTPPRQPDYRERRTHDDFVANLPADRETLCRALERAFDARTPLADWPRRMTDELVADRYSQSAWNLRL
jgi:lipoate-protein ligase A